MTDPNHHLARWEPPVADSITTTDRTPPGPVSTVPIIVGTEFDPPLAQTLAHALNRTGMGNILTDANSELDSSPWYRNLPRLTGVRPILTIENERYSVDELPDWPEGSIRDFRPARIELDLDLRLNGHRVPGHGSVIGIDTDLILASPVDSWIGEVRALVTPDTTLAVHELVEILRHAYFSPGDSFEAGPWDRQLEEFRVHANHIAHRTLADEDTAIRESLIAALKNDLLWLIPSKRRIEITIDERRRVDVRISPPSSGEG